MAKHSLYGERKKGIDAPFLPPLRGPPSLRREDLDGSSLLKNKGFFVKQKRISFVYLTVGTGVLDCP